MKTLAPHIQNKDKMFFSPRNMAVMNLGPKVNSHRSEVILSNFPLPKG
jgi:hypothetical protein